VNSPTHTPVHTPGDGADDTQLVEQARAGNEPAFEQLFTLYFPKIYGVLHQMTGDAAMSEDLAQQAMIKAWRNLAGFDARSKFSTWLYRIAVNCGRDYLRSLKSRPAAPLNKLDEDQPDPEQADTRTPEDRARASELKAALADALDKLSPEHREVFILGELQQLPYEQVSSILKCKRGTVMSRMHYARRHLLKLLQPYLPDTREQKGSAA